MIGLTQHMNRLCEALPKQSRVKAVDPGLLRSARKDRPMGYASASVDETLGFTGDVERVKCGIVLPHFRAEEPANRCQFTLSIEVLA